jgi:biopolymer transport protein ExbD
MRSTPLAGIQVQPNVTPMIDVMLVLLIIFMTIGPLLDVGFRLIPPTGQHLTQHPDEEADAVIGLDDHGHLFYNKESVTEAGLRQRLRSRFIVTSNDRVVYLRAHQGLAYSRVQAAMELATAEGAQVVGLVSEAEPIVGTRH